MTRQKYNTFPGARTLPGGGAHSVVDTVLGVNLQGVVLHQINWYLAVSTVLTLFSILILGFSLKMETKN